MTLSKEPKKSIAVEKFSMLISGDGTLCGMPEVCSFITQKRAFTAIVGNYLLHLGVQIHKCDFIISKMELCKDSI